MSEFTVLSPAKVNLNLRVLDLRDNGFHNIESTVQPVSIFDEVRIRVLPKGGVSLIIDGPCPVPAGENTAFIAAQLFVKEAGLECGVEIFLKKNIPSGAGLGGGSGNAAAVLAGLNRIFDVLRYETLCEIGNKVGSDVPLFLRCGACRISGTGATVEPLKNFPSFVYLICFPGFESRTEEVYRRWDELGLHIPPRGSAEKFWHVNPPVEMINDLQPAAFSLYPELARFYSLIEAGYGVPFLMTGSGSAFVSVFQDEKEAAPVFERIKRAGGFECFLACGIEGWREKTGERFSPNL